MPDRDDLAEEGSAQRPRGVRGRLADDYAAAMHPEGNAMTNRELDAEGGGEMNHDHGWSREREHRAIDLLGDVPDYSSWEEIETACRDETLAAPRGST